MIFIFCLFLPHMSQAPFFQRLTDWAKTKTLEQIPQLFPSEPKIETTNPNQNIKIIMQIVEQICEKFEKASSAIYSGDSFLFFKYFSNCLFNAISLKAILAERADWENPVNYLKMQFENQIERNFISELFPNISQEDGNPNKSCFIDWFLEICDNLNEKYPATIPVSSVESLLRTIYIRDYLGNFRKVSHLKNVFRSPNPARGLSEPQILAHFFEENKIKLVVDLRGEEEAKRSEYVYNMLNQLRIKPLLIDFNARNVVDNEVANDYVRKLKHSKPMIKEVFEEFSKTDGAVLFHCASGKDRTGVMVALFQKLAGVKDRDIIDEYTKSGHDSREERIDEVLKFLNNNGGIDEFIASCGISKELKQRVLGKILPP